MPNDNESTSSPAPATNQPEGSPAPAPSVESVTAPATRRLRWEIGLAILMIGVSLISFMWYRADGDSSEQILILYKFGLGTVLAMVLWWVLLSGINWGLRLGVVAAAAVVVVAFAGMNRFDGFTGDFIPQFSPRWSATPEESVAAFAATQQNQSTPSESQTSPPIVGSAGDWPQFRGPNRNGILHGVSLRRDWDVNPPAELWRHPVGLGWSSFAVVGNRAFTQEQRSEDEVVVCYDVETGNQIWIHSDPVRFSNTMGGDGPRATPTLHDSMLYTLGGTGLLNCLDPRTGERLWKRDIIADADSKVANFGMAGSPLVYDDLVVVSPGGGNRKGVIAYNRHTGDIVWARGNRKVGYVAPRLETIDGVRQLLIYGAFGLAGHDAQTGEELWWFDWENSTRNNCVQPILLDTGLVFLSSGYGKGTALIDVHRVGQTWSAETTGWETAPRFKLKFNGGVLKNGYVYGLNEGILTCLNTKTGKQEWKRGRYKFGQLLLVDDLLLILSEKGDVSLVEASPERYNEVARFKAISGKTWNHPVVSGGRLFIRNAREVACFDLR